MNKDELHKLKLDILKNDHQKFLNNLPKPLNKEKISLIIDFITAEIKNALKIPAIISLHDTLYPSTIRAFDYVITVVEWMKDAIINKYNYHNVRVLLNRIDENLFKPQKFTNIPSEFRKQLELIRDDYRGLANEFEDPETFNIDNIRSRINI